MTDVDGLQTRRSAARALNAARWSFIIFGVTGAAWAVRIPQIRDRLRLDPADLGFVLLAVAAGVVGSMAVAGRLVQRFGPAHTVAIGAITTSCGLLTVTAGDLAAQVPVVTAGLLLVGCGAGPWDVAINVHAGAVEHQARRSLLPRLHAWFSVGAVAGALLGSLSVRIGVPVPIHLAALGIGIVTSIPWVVRSYLPPIEPHGRDGADSGVTSPRRLDIRVILIGLTALTATFSEGAGNDWASIATIDGHHLSRSLGALALATVLAATTVVRWFAPSIVDVWGRAATLRVFSVAGAFGILIFVTTSWTPLVFLGLAMWGAGFALGFPIGMSAANDDPRGAAQRVSTVAAVGYTGMLMGPVVIGFLGDQLGVLHGLLAVAVMLLIGAALSASVSKGPRSTHKTL